MLTESLKETEINRALRENLKSLNLTSLTCCICIYAYNIYIYIYIYIYITYTSKKPTLLYVTALLYMSTFNKLIKVIIIIISKI